MNRWLFLLAVVLAACFTTGSFAGEKLEKPEAPTWPQWRGPNRDGQLGGPAWPDRLSKDPLTQLWRVPLGPSYSGPIVAEDLVFTTETKNKETEIVYSLDRKTGKERWRAEWQHTFEAVGEGTLMRDAVRYALPLGFLGRLAQRCFVRSDLDSIFDYRAREVAALLGFELTHA
jgi:hypothetical protein